jgi:uncharacterized phage-associated protein
MTPSVFDVAKYILSKTGDISAVKLQKLVYYCQAWSLVWDDNPLFESRIEAWVGGPVCPELYNAHKGMFKVNKDTFQGNENNLSEENIATINEVLSYYGNKDAQWLSDLTHMETPWIEARIGLSTNERGNHEIKLDKMMEYYSSL